MTHWLTWVWAQVWPNLAADVLWVPAAALYHRWLNLHLAQVRAAVRELEELRRHLHAGTRHGPG